MKRYRNRLIMLLFALAAGAYAWHDYFTSLQVTDAQIIDMVDDPGLRGGKVLRVVVTSSFPPWRIVPDALRRFFPLQPKLCIQNVDGSGLVNDDAWTSRFLPEDGNKGPHAVARREFRIPFLLKPGEFNGERRFFKSLVQNHGLWASYRLEGFFLPPTVNSKPFFLNLAPWCQAHPGQCQQVFGWEK